MRWNLSDEPFHREDKQHGTSREPDDGNQNPAAGFQHPDLLFDEGKTQFDHGSLIGMNRCIVNHRESLKPIWQMLTCHISAETSQKSMQTTASFFPWPYDYSRQVGVWLAKTVS
ncbi:MAG: hypothetical protein ABSF60_09100 [Verrucomicrobiota bacterium]